LVRIQVPQPNEFICTRLLFKIGLVAHSITAMAITMMVVAPPVPVDTQCAIHRPDPCADGAPNNSANRSGGSIAFMGALLRAAYQPLSLHADRPSQHREKSNGQYKT
jgi:hypothetical protein